jgi:hypothetical protein
LSVGLTRNKGASPPDAASSSGTGTTTSTPAADSNGGSSTGTVSTTKEDSSASPTTFYKDSSGSMGVTLKLFSPDITKSYLNDDELKADLTEVAKFIAVNVIKSNVAEIKFWETYGNDWNFTYGNDWNYTFGNHGNSTDLWNQTEETAGPFFVQNKASSITADDTGTQGTASSTTSASTGGTSAEVPNPTR